MFYTILGTTRLLLSNSNILAIEMLNTREIIVSLTTNQLIIINLDTFQTRTCTTDIVIVSMRKYNSSVYGVDNNNNFYSQTFFKYFLVFY